MKFGAFPLEKAEGLILAHHILGPHGGKTLRKGRRLSAQDIAALRREGRELVYAAEIEPGDVNEDQAAQQVAALLAGDGLEASPAHSGRATLRAMCLGVLHVDAARLARLNEIDGVAVATRPAFSVAGPRQAVATVKVIPFALPGEALEQAAAICGASEGGAESGINAGLREDRPLLSLRPLPAAPVALLLSGSSRARERVLADFTGALQTRLDALGARLATVEYLVAGERGSEARGVDAGGETALAGALLRLAGSGARLILMAGETAIMDRRDVTPRAVELAGGQVVCFGAPVEPGNLFMLAYLQDIPLVGAPGCTRSLKPNIVDLVLPRLLSGERLQKKDILALGHGGLL
jgi:molybdenum cofactor cytidylyltransferase